MNLLKEPVGARLKANAQIAKKTLIIAYTILLTFSVLYVHKIISSGEVRIKDLPTEQKQEDPEEVKATLIITGLSGSKSYQAKGFEPYTLLDMLEELHNETDLYYEKTLYTYGTKIDGIDRQFAPAGYDWKLFYNSKEVSSDLSVVQLENRGVYELKLIRI